MNKEDGCPKCGSGDYVFEGKPTDGLVRRIYKDHQIYEEEVIVYDTEGLFQCDKCGHEFDEPAEVKDEKESDS